MMKLIDFNTLGHARYDWLDTRHHFSFADYRDPERVHWGALRVFNDDIIRAGTGFPRHGHRDMEIITYVLEGAISHKDSLGNSGRTVAGDVQVMSAGTGIEHSEYNHESIDTHIFQLWILPAAAGGAPRWETAAFPKGDRAGEFVTLASGRPGDEGVPLIRQDAAVKGATLLPGRTLRYRLEAGRFAYLVPGRGEVAVNGLKVGERSGLALKDAGEIEILSEKGAELLLIDIPPAPGQTN